MKIQDAFRSLVVACVAGALLAGAANAATATGTVRDASGNPVAGATVLVYSAGVRKGYSTFCPTCYADSGKRVTTDAQGNYSIAGLDDELVFNLITMRDGFAPAWVRGVDPEKGAAAPATLKARPLTEAGRSVLGRVVDVRGNGVPDALVEVAGILAGDSRSFGNFGDGLTISDANGFFDLGTITSLMPQRVPTDGYILEVKPRGMAPALYTAAFGPKRQEFKVTDGATVHGRLLSKGKPVPNAQFQLLTLTRYSGQTYSPMYIGTDEKGRFAITNVPAGRVWTLDANSDSLGGIGSVATHYVATHADDEVVDAGDVEVKPGYSLSGRIVLSDGNAVPPDMRVSISNTTGGTRTSMLAADGEFEFKGLSGPYQLVPAVRGYRLPQGSMTFEMLIERNTDGVTIKLEPAPPMAQMPRPAPAAAQP